MDWIFYNFKWYRKLRGGIWRQVYIKQANAEYWIRNTPPFPHEMVVDTEDYRLRDSL